MSDPLPKDRVFNVLFLCTHNSARSILAEAILNSSGKGKFKAFSAGSEPRGQTNPHAIDLLKNLGYDVSCFRSKSWDEFAGADAPQWTSYSPSAITPPTKSALCGQVNR